jgi:hypothetical protein
MGVLFQEKLDLLVTVQPHPSRVTRKGERCYLAREGEGEQEL